MPMLALVVLPLAPEGSLRQALLLAFGGGQSKGLLQC